MNRLQRPYQDSEGTLWSETSIEPGYTYTNYETNINFKIFTDKNLKTRTFFKIQIVYKLIMLKQK